MGRDVIAEFFDGGIERLDREHRAYHKNDDEEFGPRDVEYERGDNDEESEHRLEAETELLAPQQLRH